ncbi:hypothetical protein SISSUDRAFT_1116728 [Sistotremastrum suecicum HHB10207 ss-3]|uniref:Uncharacterized protein n=1 Tax=Sistotremastrum suecicum HHB10207 ss-3 TaxID=1314776 RepID=A0A166HHD3_9AGAM|nr:hypothetical protein SISSUDRAFT_1116728 [Sistotremastrum suecicum HHB10207 ss-3]
MTMQTPLRRNMRTHLPRNPLQRLVNASSETLDNIFEATAGLHAKLPTIEDTLSRLSSEVKALGKRPEVSDRSEELSLQVASLANSVSAMRDTSVSRSEFEALVAKMMNKLSSIVTPTPAASVTAAQLAFAATPPSLPQVPLVPTAAVTAAPHPPPISLAGILASRNASRPTSMPATRFMYDDHNRSSVMIGPSKDWRLKGETLFSTFSAVINHLPDHVNTLLLTHVNIRFSSHPEWVCVTWPTPDVAATFKRTWVSSLATLQDDELVRLRVIMTDPSSEPFAPSYGEAAENAEILQLYVPPLRSAKAVSPY